MKGITKKLFAILLAVAIAASLAACGGGGSGGDAQSSGGGETPTAEEPSGGGDGGGGEAPANDTLTITCIEDNGTLDPLLVTGTSFLEAVRTYTDVLFENKPDGSIEWGLATSMDTVSDIEYTLHLREGVTFSNGNPFTADDVLFSMGLQQTDPQHQLNVKVIDFEKTKKIDDYTVDLWLTHYDVTQFPGFFLLYMFDEESYDAAEMAVNPIGTGPYIVKEYVTNSHLIVEARDDYWGEPPEIKRIEFKVMNEESQRVNAVETGDTDMAEIPLKDVEYVQSLGTYDVKVVSSAATATIYFNCSPTGTPMNSAEAREAVMHAIDRQSIVNLVYNGQGNIPTWPVSNDCVDFEERFANADDTYSIGYDPALAKELAEGAGLVGQKLRIITNGTAAYVKIAEIIQGGLLEIGVESEISNFDQATYMSIVADPSNFDIAVYVTGSGSGLGVDILAMYPLFIPLGWTGENHDTYMALGQEACGTMDEQARSEKLLELTQLFYVDQPWYALADMPRAVAYSKRVTNIDYYVVSYVRFNNWKWA